MRGFVVRVLLTGVALWLAALVVPGVRIEEADLTRQIITVLVVAVVFGVVNGVLKPIVKVLAFPLYILTLGLFALVVNALLFWLSAWVAGELDLAFSVDGFWSALLGALVVSVVTMISGAND